MKLKTCALVSCTYIEGHALGCLQLLYSNLMSLGCFFAGLKRESGVPLFRNRILFFTTETYRVMTKSAFTLNTYTLSRVICYVWLFTPQIACCTGQMKIRRANIGVDESSYKQHAAIFGLPHPIFPTNAGRLYQGSVLKVGPLEVDLVPPVAMFSTAACCHVNLVAWQALDGLVCRSSGCTTHTHTQKKTTHVSFLCLTVP